MNFAILCYDLRYHWFYTMTVEVLIRLCRWAVWSGTSLSTYAEDTFSHGMAHIKMKYTGPDSLPKTYSTSSWVWKWIMPLQIEFCRGEGTRSNMNCEGWNCISVQMDRGLPYLLIHDAYKTLAKVSEMILYEDHKGINATAKCTNWSVFTVHMYHADIFSCRRVQNRWNNFGLEFNGPVNNYIILGRL